MSHCPRCHELLSEEPPESFPPHAGNRESLLFVLGLFSAGVVVGMMLLYGIRG